MVRDRGFEPLNTSAKNRAILSLLTVSHQAPQTTQSDTNRHIIGTNWHQTARTARIPPRGRNTCSALSVQDAGVTQQPPCH
jgi:hypothetical protein